MRRPSTLFNLAIQLAVVVSLLSAPAAAADKQYVYCWSAGLKPDGPGFFSKVFLAETTKQQAIEIAFGKYVMRNYEDDNPGPGQCNYYSSKDATESALDTARKEVKWNNRRVVDTGWVYSE